MKVKSLINWYWLEYWKIYEVYSISPRWDSYYIFVWNFLKNSINFPWTELYWKQLFEIIEWSEKDIWNLKFINISKLISSIIYSKYWFNTNIKKYWNFNDNILLNSIEKILDINFSKKFKEYKILNLNNKKNFYKILFEDIVENYWEQKLIQILVDIFDYSIFNDDILEKININWYINNIKWMIYKWLFYNDQINENIKNKELLRSSWVDVDNFENINIEKLSKYFSWKLPNSINLNINEFVNTINKNNNNKWLDLSYEDNTFLSNYIFYNSNSYFLYKKIFQEILTKKTKFTILVKILDIFDLPYSFLHKIDYSKYNFQRSIDDYYNISKLIIQKNIEYNLTIEEIKNILIKAWLSNTTIKKYLKWNNLDLKNLFKDIDNYWYDNLNLDTLINNIIKNEVYNDIKKEVKKYLDEDYIFSTWNEINFDELSNIIIWNNHFNIIWINKDNLFLNNKNCIMNIKVNIKKLSYYLSEVSEFKIDKIKFNELLNNVLNDKISEDKFLQILGFSRNDKEYFEQVFNYILDNKTWNNWNWVILNFISNLEEKLNVKIPIEYIYNREDIKKIGNNDINLKSIWQNKKLEYSCSDLNFNYKNMKNNNRIKLEKNEIIKRLWEQNINIEKLKLNNSLVKKYIKWFWELKWLKEYFSNEISEDIFKELKKYINFYLYKQEINDGESKFFKYKLYISFDSMSFWVYLWIDSEKLNLYINIIKDHICYFLENFNDYKNEFNDLNLIDIKFFEWKNEDKIFEYLVEKFNLVTHEDIKSKFEIWDEVKFQVYQKIYFSKIKTKIFNIYKKEWEYYVSWFDNIIYENELELLKK